MTIAEAALASALTLQGIISLWLYLLLSMERSEAKKANDAFHRVAVERELLIREIENEKSRLIELSNSLAEWGARAGTAEARLASMEKRGE